MNSILCLSMLFAFSCEPPPLADQSGILISHHGEQARQNNFLMKSEEYIMVTTSINLPLYVNHDEAAFRAWGEKAQVKTSILGPSEWNITDQIAVIEQLIPQHPAGLLINGTDPALAQVIRNCVHAGIPTLVYDADIAGSNRDCFIGSDWYQMGWLQGRKMAELIGKKGKVACMGILGLSNMETGFRGFRDAVAGFPDIQLLGNYDDNGNLEMAANQTADLLSAHHDLAGIAGFDSNSGPGIALTVKEFNKKGLIKITCVDAEPEHLALVREGTIAYLVGQKRELFTWLGAQFLFDMNHRTIQTRGDQPVTGFETIPSTVITGPIEIDRTNIEEFTKR